MATFILFPSGHADQDSRTVLHAGCCKHSTSDMGVRQLTSVSQGHVYPYDCHCQSVLTALDGECAPLWGKTDRGAVVSFPSLPKSRQSRVKLLHT